MALAQPMLLDEQISRNKAATARLFFLVFLILAAMVFVGGYIFFGNILVTAFLALVIGLVYLAIASASSVPSILRAARARPANPAVREEKLLMYKVEELALAAQIPVPAIFVQPDDDINAFATGKDPQHSIVCVTTGALAALNQEELEGVLGHEMSHIRNYDIRVTTYAIALIGLIAIFGEILVRSLFFGGGRRGSSKEGGGAIIVVFLIAIVFVILAPILSRLVYFAISRKREYLADASGAMLTRNPDGLASALEKIAAREPRPNRGDRTVAALYLDNPFRRRGARASVWASHPPIEERIKRLRGQA